MADQAGIDLMRRRIERASRQAPPSRRPPEGTAVQEAAPDAVRETAPVPAAAPAVAAEPGPRPQRSSRPGRPAPGAQTLAPAAPLRLGADLPPVNLAIRVRKPLDDRLADVIHQLRQDGVRTSKVELIEMLLWEMPEGQTPALRERLRHFRDWAPRGTGAPLSADGAG